MIEKDAIFYRRHLPHLHPRGAIFFITFGLVDSIPDAVLQKLKEERDDEIKQLHRKFSGKELEEEKYKAEKRHFSRYDEWLDRAATGPQWLKEERIGQIVADKIHDLHGKRYELISYCIMSNHVHISFDTAGYEPVTAGTTRDYPVTDTMRLLKGSTSRFCNLALGRTGERFWHKESYDHYVRDKEELFRIIEYILNNPVKAGLVQHREEWKFCHYEPSHS